MSKRKVVFIQPSLEHPRSIKRIEEFIANGYEVEVFGFRRLNGNINLRKISYQVTCVGEFRNELSYVKRLPILYKAIKNIVNRFKNERVVYYLFGLETAFIFRFVCNLPYIFEESDLTHTYLGSSLIRNILEFIDCYIIRKSLLSVFTSDGFVRFHFGKHRPRNITLITNRLHHSVLDLKQVQKMPINMNHIRFGFVGVVRFNAIMNFAETIIKHFPQHEFHFFGGVSYEVADKCKELEKYSNCHFHGKFMSPIDLPEIYSQLDLVLSTYDVTSENVRWAEPNKLYESIYFETPIIVSKSTFLADRVKELGIGFEVDAMSQTEIINLVDLLSLESMSSKIKACAAIPKDYAVNKNDTFFNELKEILDKLNANVK